MEPLNPLQSISSGNLPIPSIEQQIPSDVMRLFFSYLSPRELLPVSLVNKRWRALCMTATPKIPQNVGDDFLPLITKGLMNSLELTKFECLSGFLARCLQKNHSNGTVNVPQPFVQFGQLSFKITFKYQIEVRSKFEKYILEDPLKRKIAFLAVQGNCVFALTKNGQIIQWNYKTRSIIQTLETGYSEKHESLKEFWERGYNFYTHDCYYVDDQFILIKYGMALTRIVEIIPYHSLNNRQLFTLPANCYPHRILKKKDHVFFLNRNSVLIAEVSPINHGIVQYKTVHIKMDPSHFLWDISVTGNTLYTNGTDSTFYVIDIATGNEIAKFPFGKNERELLKIEVLDNLLFAYQNVRRNFSQIYVYDLCTKDLIGVFEMNENLLEKLIPITRTHKKRSPYIKSSDAVIQRQSGCTIM
jgi:hypothetical protein